MKHQLFDQFVHEKTVVIMRGLTPEKAQACGDALVKAGIHLMEVPELWNASRSLPIISAERKFMSARGPC